MVQESFVTNGSSKQLSASMAMNHMTISGVKNWCATFAAEAFFVAAGNLFIIIVFTKTKELRRNRQLFFLMNLAMADVLVGTLAEPLFVYVLGGYYNIWNFDNPNIFGFATIFLDMFSGISSIAFLTAIALERFYATMFPVRYRKTRNVCYAMIILTLWALSAAVPVGRLMFGNDYDSLYLWMPLVCILLLLIGTAYFAIWIKVLFLSTKRTKARESRLNVTLTILTVTSLSTWLPFIILNTVNMFQPVNLAPVYGTKLLHYGNSLLNPFLFALKMPKFRNAAKKIFCTTRRNDDQTMCKGDNPLREMSTKNKSLERLSSQIDRSNFAIRYTTV
ncbi:opsin-1-like isoform X2 [Montipora capricornis]|uniref:opsin-1-like isoform X2 n=1 Tax=Montipora capricornis TaxID=246305 RepID=UPI0035F21CD1